MVVNTERWWLAAMIAAAPAIPTHAASVACHVTYGGETQTISAAPTTQPLAVAPIPIGSYFLFRIVFRQEPADLATIKLTTYADRDEGPTIIHQATYAYPPAPAVVHGFTGLNFVYEPVRDGELRYWCEMKDAP
ncbi:MAG TPA: hypothetical protein PK503_02185 [Azonexus sp.]|nr:hypothetical protein [Azonexus sp.]